MKPGSRTTPHRIAAVRRFNRFYTRRIGALQGGLLESPYSLTEVRVLYELAHRDKPTATELAGELGLDAGYLSRILLRFRKEGLLASAGSKEDARRTHLWLSAKGRRIFAPLERRTNDQIASMLGKLPQDNQGRVIEAMRSVEVLLDDVKHEPEFSLRAHRPGDMGWVISAHGALYAEEFGFSLEFEALVADIAATFIRNLHPDRERCWIAEMNGETTGSVFLVEQSKTVAKLRLLIVDPKARGFGLGKRLVDTCIAHARKLGYRKITLWTQSTLLSARHLYKEAGFRLTKTEPHRSFGVDLVGEFWELKLR